MTDIEKVASAPASSAEIELAGYEYRLIGKRDLPAISARFDEIAESTSVASSPSTRSIPRESDNFDDAALASLFAPLLRNV